MKVLNCVVLATTLFCTVAGCRKAELPDFVTADEKNAMETNQGIPRRGKAGIGIINTDSYVVTSSTKNELIFDSRKNWKGHSASTPEVVVIFDGKVWAPHSLPHEFNKSKSLVISFEERKICFYDFAQNAGGYYERWDTEERNAD
jgi:hypothetical protein